MTGVIIDVQTQNAEKAQRDLSNLNKSLGDMVLKGDKAQRKLSAIDARNFKDLTSSVKSSNIAIRQFETTAGSSLKNIDKNAAGLNKSLGSMKTLITSVATGFAALAGVTLFLKAGDELLAVNNRLKLVTDSTEALIRKQRILFQVSQQARTGFQETADTYTTLVKSFKGQGIDDSRLLKVTKAIQQSAAQSAGSVEGVKAAMTQLNQSFASGIVQAQEFNSVAEQFPYLLDKISTAMGKTTGQLRTMVLDGKVSARSFFDAIEKSASVIEKDMASATITASQGFNTLRQSLKFYVADLNVYLGVSTKVGTYLTKISSKFGTSSNTLIVKLATTKQAYKNYLTDLRAMYERFNRTGNFGLPGVDGITDGTARKLKQQAAKVVGTIDAMFNKTAPKITLMEKLFSRLKLPTAEDGGSLFSAGNIKKSVESVILLFTELTHTMTVTAHNVKALLPNILLPIMTYFSSFMGTILIEQRTWSTNLYKALLPGIRQLEALKEYSSIFFLGDNRLPRAVSNLFRSKSLDEFTRALANVNSQWQFMNGLVRYDSTQYFISEKTRLIREMGWAVQDVAISLGIMDNKLLRVRDLKLDRLFQAFRLIGDVFRRVYDDHLAPAINLFAYKFTLTFLLALKTVSDAMANTFTLASGRDIGEKLSRGIIQGFKAAVSLIASLGGRIKAPDNVTGQLGETIVENFKETFKGLPGFVFGIFSGIGKTIREELAKIDFSQLAHTIAQGIGKGISYIIDMFAKIFSAATHYLLGTEKRVSKFATNIKNFFYEIWDAVVGHSYWPDTIDGVVSYTKKLFGAEDDVKSFREKILNVFKGIFEGLKGYMNSAGGFMSKIFLAVKEVDWGASMKIIAASLGTVLFAAFNLLKHTGPFGILQYFLSSYLVGILDATTGGLGAAVGPEIGKRLGDAFYEIFKYSLVGAFRGILIAASALSEFMISAFSGALDDFASIFGINLNGIFENAFRGVLNFVPFLSNQLLVGFASITAIVYFASKKLRDTINGVLFGITAGKGQKGKKGILGSLLGVFGGALDFINPKAFTTNLAKNLISEKLFAGLLGASLIAGMTGAVDIFTAAEAALGFGILTVFGGAGGARLVKDLSFSLFNTIKGALSIALGSLASSVLPASIGKQVTDTLASGFSNVNLRGGKVSKALALVYRQMDIMSASIARNRKAYGDNKISFSEMIFGGGENSESSKGFYTNAAGIRKRRIANFGLAFRGVGKAITQDASVKQVISGFKQIKDSIGASSLDIFSGLRGIGAMSSLNIGGIAGNVTSKLSTSFKVIFAALVSNLAKMKELLMKSTFLKVALAGTLLFGFAGFANAATTAGGAVEGLSDNITGLAVSLGLLFTVFKSLQFAKNMRRTFVDTKAVALERLIQPRLDSFVERTKRRNATQVVTYADDLKTNGRNGRPSPRVFGKQLNRELERDTEKRKERLGNKYKGLANKEARDASLGHVIDLKNKINVIAGETLFSETWRAAQTARLKALGVAALALGTKIRMNTTLSNVGGAIGGAATSMGKAAISPSFYKNAPGKIWDAKKWLNPNYVEKRGISLLSKGGTQSPIKGGASALFQGLKGVGQVLTGAFGGLARMIFSSGRVLVGAITFLGELIGIPFAGFIALGALVVGAFVGFLGPMDSFTENLKWAADKIKGWFGFKATSDSGIGEQNVKDYGVYDIGGKKRNVRDELMNVDYSKLSDLQKKANAEFLKENDAELRALELSSQQNPLNATDNARVDELLNNRTNQLARLPGLDNSGTKNQKTLRDASFKAIMSSSRPGPTNESFDRAFYGGDVGHIDKRVSSDWRILNQKFDNSKAVKSIVKTRKEIDEGFNNWVSSLGDEILKNTNVKLVIGAGRLAGKTNDRIRAWQVNRSKDPQDAFKQTQADRANRASMEADKFFRYLPKDRQNSTNALQAKYVAQTDKVAELQNNKSFFFPKESQKEIDVEKKKLEEIALLFERIQKENVKLGQSGLRKENLSKLLTNVGSMGKALEVEYGVNGELFSGGDAGVKLLEANTKQLAEAKNIILNAEDLAAKTKGLAMALSSQKREEGYKSIADSNLLIGTQTEQASTAIGDMLSPDALGGFLRSGTAEKFNEATTAYKRLKLELETAPTGTTAAEFAKLETNVTNAKVAMLKLVPITADMESLNTVLEKAGVSSLSLDAYLSAPAAGLIELAGATRDSKLAFDNLTTILQKPIDATNLEDYRKALERVRDTMATVKIKTAGVMADSLSRINGQEGLSPQAKAAAIAAQLGQKLNPRIAGSASKSKAYVEKSTRLARVNQNLTGLGYFLERGQLSPLQQNQFNKTTAEQTSLTEGLDLLDNPPTKSDTRKQRLTFKELMTSLNSTGVNVSDLGFTRLPTTAQKALQDVGQQINKLDNTLDDIKPGTNVSKLIEEKLGLLKKARELLVNSFGNTGEALGQSLERSGISGLTEISKLSTAKMSEIVALDQKIEIKKLEALEAKSPAEYLKLTKEIASLEEKRLATVKRLTNFTEVYFERINEVFGTNFDFLNMDMLGVKMSKQLSVFATGLKEQLEKLKNTGSSDLAGTFEEQLAQIRVMMRSMAGPQLFYDMNNALETGLVGSARTAFDQIQEVFSNSTMTEKMFRNMSRPEQDNLTRQANDLEWFDKAANLSDPSQKQVDLLSTFASGKPIAEIRAEFQTLFPSLAKNLMPIAELQVTELAENTKALREFRAKLTPTSSSIGSLSAASDYVSSMGARVSEYKGRSPVGKHTNGSKHYDGKAFDINFGTGKNEWNDPQMKAKFLSMQATLEAQGFKVLFGVKDHFDHMHVEWTEAVGKIGNQVAETVAASDPAIVVTGIPANANQFVPNTAPRVDSAALDLLADLKSRDYNTGMTNRNKFNRIGGNISERARYLASDTQLTTIDNMSSNIDNARRTRETMLDKGQNTTAITRQIEEAQQKLEKFGDAIENFGTLWEKLGDDMAKSLDGTFHTAIMGALTGQEDVLKTLLDSVTSQILNTIVSGFLDPITGENGILTKGIQSLFGMVKPSGAMPEGGGGFGGILSGIFGGGSKVAPVAEGMSGAFNNISSIAQKSPIISATKVLGTGISDVFSSGTDLFGSTGGDVATTISTGLSEAGTKVAGDLSGALGAGGAGGGGGGLAGLAGMAGGIFGMLIGSLFADGGDVRGAGTGTSDSIPARLSNGEFVVKASQVKKYRPIIKAINDNNFESLAFAAGGDVGRASMSSVLAIPTVSVIDDKKMANSQNTKTEINLGITGDISKQTRRQIYEMLPQIAEGVNSHNREKGYR